MKLRPMVIADVVSVHHIDQQSFPDPWKPQQHEEEFGRSWSWGLVATDDNDQVVGYLRYWLVADEMQILNVAVDPRQRNRGVAAALLRRGIDDARCQGATEATLEMRSSNVAARSCYESMGFRVVGRRPAYYGDEDAILLTWTQPQVVPIRGVYIILDDGFLKLQDIPAMAQRMADLGCRIFQVRCKQHTDREVLGTLDRTRDALEGYAAMLLVNDRPDLARMADLSGVHVGQTDVPPRVARRTLGKSAIVGYSTHNPDQFDAGRGEPIDYLALGPIFTTTTKTQADPTVGLETLASLCRRTMLPVVAIGGITERQLPRIREAGAQAFVVISALWTATSPVAYAQALIRAWGDE